MDAEVSSALFAWEEADRRLNELIEADPSIAPVVGRLTGRIHDQLRRRVGSTFTVDELAQVHAGGADWALEELDHQAHGRLIADAAFHSYARRAADYVGGRAFR